MRAPSDLYARTMAGEECWLRSGDGSRQAVPVQRWLGQVDAAGSDALVDLEFVRGCVGPTLDLGCGPGRLTAKLLHCGVTALGVDVSSAAVAMTRGRGAPALQRDVFDHLPNTGHWRHVLLADGNIGIGGDPWRILRRVWHLLAGNGTAIVEFDTPGTGLIASRVRLETATDAGPWHPWARVGVERAAGLASSTGFRLSRHVEVAGRHIVTMVKS